MFAKTVFHLLDQRSLYLAPLRVKGSHVVGKPLHLVGKLRITFATQPGSIFR